MHIDERTMKKLVDGTLEDRLEAAGHIAECSECLERFTALCELAPSSPPRGFSQYCVQELERRTQKVRGEYFRYVAGVALGAAATIALIFSGFVRLPEAKAEDAALPVPEVSELPAPSLSAMPSPEQREDVEWRLRQITEKISFLKGNNDDTAKE